MKNVKTQSNFRASRKNTFLTAKTKNEKRKAKKVKGNCLGFAINNFPRSI